MRAHHVRLVLEGRIAPATATTLVVRHGQGAHDEADRVRPKSTKNSPRTCV